MTTPDPLPPCWALLARIVTTDGRAWSATLAAGQAADGPPEPDAVAFDELPFPEPQVALTISPPTTPPTTAASRSAISKRMSPRPRSSKAHLPGRLRTTIPVLHNANRQ